MKCVLLLCLSPSLSFKVVSSPRLVGTQTPTPPRGIMFLLFRFFGKARSWSATQGKCYYVKNMKLTQHSGTVCAWFPASTHTHADYMNRNLQRFKGHSKHFCTSLLEWNCYLILTTSLWPSGCRYFQTKKLSDTRWVINVMYFIVESCFSKQSHHWFKILFTIKQ